MGKRRNLLDAMEHHDDENDREQVGRAAALSLLVETYTPEFIIAHRCETARHPIDALS